MSWDKPDSNEPPENLRQREGGSTTLEQCGWCEYASGSHRFSYCISGKCRLGKSYDKDVKWDTPCRIATASKSDLEALVKNHEYTINNCDGQIKRQQETIAILQERMKDATDRPPLPSDRPHDHFNIDDRIRVFMDGEWVSGEGRNGYRHHDGCVSYRLNGKGPQLEGFWGMGYAVPSVMLETTAIKLLESRQEASVWFEKACDKDFNGEKISGSGLLDSLFSK